MSMFGDTDNELSHFSKVMAEMVNCPHPLPSNALGQGRG